MPFYIYGKHAVSGEIAKRVYSGAATAEEAREEATAQGLEVSALVPCLAPAAASPVAGNGALAAPRATTGAPAAQYQFRKELDFVTQHAYATYGLIAANVLVFGMMCLSGVSPKDPTINGLMAWGADFAPSTLGGQWWRLFSSLFVHIGAFHLLCNMLALVPAGRPLERLVGSANFLLIYLVAGLGGSLWALYWSPLILSAGASGAVFGVYGALGALVFMRGRAMPPDLVAALKKSVYSFVVYNAVYSLRPGISLAAHAGGLVVGFALGLLVARADTAAEEAELIPNRALHASLAGVLLLVAGLFGLHLRYPSLAQLQDAFARFDALDLKDSEIVSDVAKKFDRKDLSGADFAKIVSHDVLPDWSSTREQIAAYQPVPRGMQDEVRAIIDYMQARSEGWKLLSDAVLDGGKDKLDVATKKMREANMADGEMFRRRTRIFPDSAKG